MTRNQFCFFSPQASSQVSIPSTSAECTQVGYFVTPFWLFFWLGLWGPHKTVFKLFFLSFKRFLLFNLSSFSVPSLSLLVCSADTLPPLPILATLPLYSTRHLPPKDGPGDLINLVFPSLSLLVCSAHTLPPSQFWQPCLLALLLPFPRFYLPPNSGNPASSLSFFSFLPQDFTTLPILATLPLLLLSSFFSLPQDFTTLPILSTLPLLYSPPSSPSPKTSPPSQLWQPCQDGPVGHAVSRACPEPAPFGPRARDPGACLPGLHGGHRPPHPSHLGDVHTEGLQGQPGPGGGGL